MDPNQALNDLTRAFEDEAGLPNLLSAGERRDLADVADGLADWILRDGALPFVRFDIGRRVTFLRANGLAAPKATILFMRARDCIETGQPANRGEAARCLRAVAHLLRGPLA